MAKIRNASETRQGIRDLNGPRHNGRSGQDQLHRVQQQLCEHAWRCKGWLDGSGNRKGIDKCKWCGLEDDCGHPLGPGAWEPTR